MFYVVIVTLKLFFTLSMIDRSRLCAPLHCNFRRSHHQISYESQNHRIRREMSAVVKRRFFADSDNNHASPSKSIPESLPGSTLESTVLPEGPPSFAVQQRTTTPETLFIKNNLFGDDLKDSRSSPQPSEESSQPSEFNRQIVKDLSQLFEDRPLSTEPTEVPPSTSTDPPLSFTTVRQRKARVIEGGSDQQRSIILPVDAEEAPPQRTDTIDSADSSDTSFLSQGPDPSKLFGRTEETPEADSTEPIVTPKPNSHQREGKFVLPDGTVIIDDRHDDLEPERSEYELRRRPFEYEVRRRPFEYEVRPQSGYLTRPPVYVPQPRVIAVPPRDDYRTAPPRYRPVYRERYDGYDERPRRPRPRDFDVDPRDLA